MDYHSGNVNFPGGLANATSTYFSLENVLCAANFSFPASFNVTKTTTSTGVTAGSNTPIAYTLTAQNLGGVSGNVTVSDAAPAGTTYVAGSATCPGVSAPETCGVTNNSGTLTWTLTNVAGGTSAALTFSVTVPIGLRQHHRGQYRVVEWSRLRDRNLLDQCTHHADHAGVIHVDLQRRDRRIRRWQYVTDG